jgi:tungstate transport system permease protein
VFWRSRTILFGIVYFFGGVRISSFSQAFGEALRMLVSLDSELYGVIGLSLRVTLTALVLAALVGIPLGVILALKKFPGRPLVMNVINSLMSVPPVVVGLVVYILLSNQTGLVGDHRLLFTPTAMIIAQFLLALPLMMGLTSTAILSVDKLVRLTARSLGATPFQVAMKVVGEARFGIYSAMIVVFGRLLSEVGAVMMVGGNIRYMTRVMTTAIALQKGMGEFQTALALGIILLLMAFLVNGILEMLRNYGRAS